MAKRDIGQEILDSILEIKSGDVGRVHVYLTPAQIRAVRQNVGVSQSAFAAMLNLSLIHISEPTRPTT